MAEDVFGIVGSVIAGAYHVECVVAEGGFGVVYRAHHGGFRAPVALKLLKVPAQNPVQQAEFLELFRAEAELSFRLAASLPTVVRPLHVDALTTADGRFVPYMVLEWLEGLTLDALIKQRNRAGLPPVALRKLVRLLTPVARALERAHHFSGPQGSVCIVHRDLKPENIFVAQVAGEELIKILDFGIGKVKSVASQVAGRMSQEGPALMAFTPAYGAPEQWAPRHYGQTGPWTDVWGLALCMVEVMAARPLIEGDPATMMGITLDPKRRPTPRTEGVALPDAVEAVFARALALDPRARQRDAGVFWNELVLALQQSEAERGDAAARDPRSDDSAGVRVEHVEMRARPGALPRARKPSAAVERALAMDLEFDPVGASHASLRIPVTSEARLSAEPARDVVPARAAAQSGPHLVPDLEFPPPSLARRPSSAQLAAEPSSALSVLDLDDGADSDKPITLDLDLPQGDPIARRTMSSQHLRAVQLPVEQSGAAPLGSLAPLPVFRSGSGSFSAVRESPPSTAAGDAQPARVSTPDQPRTVTDGPASGRGSARPPASASRPASPLSSPSSTAGAANDARLLNASPEANPQRRPDDRRAGRSVAGRFRPTLLLLGGALLVAVLDPLYATVTGEVLEILGFRLSLLAGVLLLLALGFAVAELVRDNEAA